MEDKISVTVISDIHIDKKDFIYNPMVTSDWIFICGDIGNPFSGKYFNFIKKVSQMHKKVFLIIGNHEYYQLKYNKTKKCSTFMYDMDQVEEKIKKIANSFSNVFLLQKSIYIYNNIRIIGCTLWTECDDMVIGDMYSIKDFSNDKYRELHKNHKLFLENNISSEGMVNIVVTHHAPSTDLINKLYIGSPINSFFYCSDMDGVIAKANLWFYGHTHKTEDKIILGCRCINNAVGHSYENTGYDEKKIIYI